MDFLCFPIWVWSSAIIMDPPFACPNSIIGISRITRTLFSYQNAIFRKKKLLYFYHVSVEKGIWLALLLIENSDMLSYRYTGHVLLLKWKNWFTAGGH